MTAVPCNRYRNSSNVARTVTTPPTSSGNAAKVQQQSHQCSGRTTHAQLQQAMAAAAYALVTVAPPHRSGAYTTALALVQATHHTK